MLQLRYESYRQSVSFREFSTDLNLIAADIYNHPRFRSGVFNSHFQKYIIGDRRLQYFRYNVRNYLQSFQKETPFARKREILR